VTSEGRLWGAPTGRMFVYRTYKKKGDDVDTHAANLRLGEARALSGAGGSNTEGGWRQAFRKAGVALAEPAPEVRLVEVGISCVYGAIKRGDLIFFDDLRANPDVRDDSNVLDQLDIYSRELDDDGHPIEGTIVEKAKFHFLDALRYVIGLLCPPATDSHANAIGALRALAAAHGPRGADALTAADGLLFLTQAAGAERASPETIRARVAALTAPR